MFIFIGLFFLIHSTVQDRSVSDFTNLGYEFIPADISHPPLSTFTAKKRLYCYLECNKRIDCRTFDYDDTTKQCRLWDADTITTGSIVPSPSKPQSSVGMIRYSPNIYTNMHNQSCDKCSSSRYEVCDMTSNTCQCPTKTFSNGSLCLAQLFRNQICSRADACRSDLNLTCQPNCDFTYRCSDTPDIGVGQTVAGSCNGTIVNSSAPLRGPWGIYVSPLDDTLYVAEWDLKTFQGYSAFSRTGYIIRSAGVVQPTEIFVDNSGRIYMTDVFFGNGTIFVQRDGVNLWSFPAAGLSTSACLPTGIYIAYGIAVDRSGNIFVIAYGCHAVMKWSFNATSGTFIAGQAGILGSTNRRLNYPRFLHLDEDRNALYVSDSSNHRIQKFIIGGNGTGITVAGTGIAGIGLNQLNGPGGIWVTGDGQTLYVSDNGNNRVMKWTIGATSGSVAVGNASGTAGNTSQLLNFPCDVALDAGENYLYVADYGNHRVQRFRIQ